MKVLCIAPFFVPDIGGIETLTAQLIDELGALGHEFVIFTMHGSRQLPDLTHYGDSPVYRFPYIKRFQADTLRQVHSVQQQLRQLKQQFCPDLVHLHLGNPMPIAYFHLQMQAVYPSPTLVTLHSCFQGYPTDSNNLLVKTLCTADWVTAGSAAMLEDALTVAPEFASRASLALNCLPIPMHPPTPLPAQSHLVCVGRLIPGKGFDLAIDAVAQLAPHYPNLRLKIVGSGPLSAELQQQVVRLQLEEVVTFVGGVAPHEVYSYLAQARLVIIPSRWREPFCLVALEAAHLARPVIATQIGGLPEVVRSGETGLLVEKENPTALATAIAELLEHPVQAQQMGENAQRWAKAQFDWQTYIKTYHDLYNQLSKKCYEPTTN